jgi:hypothetical protein
MGFFGRLFGKGRKPAPASEPPQGPFMEHPTGEFPTAREALISAMERLFALPSWTRPITISGQGRGWSDDAYQIEDVVVLGRTIDFGDRTVDVSAVLTEAGLVADDIGVQCECNRVTLTRATPAQIDAFLDAGFCVGLGARPHDGEDDYAVGAEW